MLPRYDIWAYGNNSNCEEAEWEAERYPDGSWIKVSHLKEYLDNIKSSYVYVSDLKKGIFGEN
jgi:hypothetical protein